MSSPASRWRSTTRWRTSGDGPPALALTVQDAHRRRSTARSPGSVAIDPRAFFARVPAGGRVRLRWQGPQPGAGQVSLPVRWTSCTRSPFGLLERRVTIGEPDEVTGLPAVGQLSRRWHQLHSEATETRRGQRHDRSTQQQEYHGLRDYRPGDSPRWIHWRTSARLGKPMVKEFEQQHEQDLAILLDPWLPRTKVTAEQREALEEAIRFAATVCLETCRHPGRRLLLGWTGATPGRPPGAGLGQAAPRAAGAAGHDAARRPRGGLGPARRPARRRRSARRS